MIVGIDATNLRQGGGRTHLVELLRVAEPQAHDISKVIVWGGRETLALLEPRPWLEKINPIELDKGLLARSLWQRNELSSAAKSTGCNLLFVPGGNYVGSFHPIVTMSRNLLPFEWVELRRYGFSLATLKLSLLRVTQSRTFRHADGTIFLTDYAKQAVMRVTGPLRGTVAVIPHGLNRRFVIAPRPQLPIEEYTAEQPYRILYVSIIDQYKHQWNVVEAIAELRRQTGWPLILELVGPFYQRAHERLKSCLERFDPQRKWAKYYGPVPYTTLHQMYEQADLGVFASSCENMPNILLETMAAGLPIACSGRGPMPEILRDAGLYFDPEQPGDMMCTVRKLVESPQLRATSAISSFSAAQSYTWEKCATETFALMTRIIQNSESRRG